MLPSAAQQQLSQERDRLRLLLEINNTVVTNLSLHDLLLALSGWMKQFFAHDLASMVICDEETGQLRVHALDAPAPGGVLAEGSVLPLEGKTTMTFKRHASTSRKPSTT
jgi:formate hydrogenlyase transcriptional activator